MADALILVSLIGLALVVWCMHRRAERFYRSHAHHVTNPHITGLPILPLPVSRNQDPYHPRYGRNMPPLPPGRSDIPKPSNK